ncbi:MAG: aminopeptidase [Bacillota bacterium]
MEKDKSPGQILEEKLIYKKKTLWEKFGTEEKEQTADFGEKYKDFLSRAKTERLAVEILLEEARQAGFRDLRLLTDINPGQAFYVLHREKVLLLGVMGKKPLREGLRLVGAHLDSPRLDVKPQPLYESRGLALFKTHYYGGIKKYQWPAIPLALHGVVIKGNGEKIKLAIGEDEAQPVFTVTDLLPHLAKTQLQKKMHEAIGGEDLNVLTGSLPYDDEQVQDKIKLAVLNHLHRQYGLVEEDLISAELTLVPAGPARDVGFDESLVGGYGQDDRGASYAAFKAIRELKDPLHTAVAYFVDKEEIGSTGNTGAQSRFLEDAIAWLATLAAEKIPRGLWQIFDRTTALSADAVAAEDPSWAGVLDKYNAPLLGHGVVIIKYTGHGGKYDTSDAHAETVAEIRNLFNENQIIWQTGELGKVDQGGGGTIAQYLARTGMDVLDCGPSLLSVHSPFEIASKADLYMCYKAYKVFLSS